VWKIIIGFIVFAAIALFVLMKGGDIDMSGEKHGTEATHAPEPAKDAPAKEAAPAGTPSPAPAAEAPKADAAKAPEAARPQEPPKAAEPVQAGEAKK
jgi:hypothetical protein